METVQINGTPRTELGKKATRALRKAGNVPCNIYGGAENVNFSAAYNTLRPLIFTSDFRLAEITVNGKTYRAMVKDVQYDPVRDTYTHIDFQELVEDRQVRITVPLHLKGTPKGITDGGQLEQVLRRIKILALPKDLPAHIDLEVADMELGSVKRIKDLSISGVTFLHTELTPLARVIIPRQVKEDAPAAAAEGATPAAGAAAPAAADAAKAEEKKDDKKK